MSDRKENVFVEMQIRTIAMDFWASLEHKIYYKYNRQVPERIKEELKNAALTASELDRKMEKINQEVNILKDQESNIESFIQKQKPEMIVKLLNSGK